MSSLGLRGVSTSLPDHNGIVGGGNDSVEEDRQQLIKKPPRIEGLYNSTIMRLILAIVLSTIYHITYSNNSAKNLHLSTAGNYTNLSSSSETFTPHWEMIPTLAPYMGNLSCIFEVHFWDLESQKNASDLERRRNCGKWRYKPYKDWVAPDPLVVFEKLPDGATIYMMGDSIGTQHAVDLMCSLASVSKLINMRHENLPPAGGWCRNTSECKEDTRGKFTGLGNSGATFQSYDKKNTKKIHVVRASGQISGTNNKNAQRSFKTILWAGKKDDIYVINAGMHYGANIDGLVANIHEVKEALNRSKGNGARVLWRETSASHFERADGSFSEKLKESQDARSAECISHKKLNATKSYNEINGVTTPLMESLGIDVLEVWEATFLGPEFCHVGAGVDCAHFLQPGITSYFTESLFKYIEEKM